MNENIHRIWAEIDLDAIGHNMRVIREHTDKNAKIMAIVKADAYGHGVVSVARTMIENGADAFGVACVDEAIQLRRNGFSIPILVLGATLPCEAETIVDYDITTAAFDFDNAKHLSEVAVKKGKRASVHIKVDTGMSRIGIVAVQEGAEKQVKKIASLPGIEITGIFSHFSCADTDNEELTFRQFDRFVSFCDKVKNEGINLPLRHICNSAAIFRYPHMQLDMVRAGIVCYGLYPSEKISGYGLEPAMSLKTSVSRVEKLLPGESVSYGAVYTATEEKRIATLMAGYADGYSRLFSKGGRVILGGEYAKILGKICMDQCMVDVSNVNNISVGDVATLFGKSDDKCIPVEELAALSGTINYEIICMISRRVPRVYKEDGKYTFELNYITDNCKQ